MPVFSNSDEMWQVMGPLWDQIKTHPTMSQELLKAGLIVQFRYREPELVLTIDCSDHQDIQVILGSGPNKPVVVMSMKSDVAHQFWLGKVNVPVAILTGKISSTGPTQRALALLPIIQPAFQIYVEILNEHGKATLIHK